MRVATCSGRVPLHPLRLGASCPRPYLPRHPASGIKIVLHLYSYPGKLSLQGYRECRARPQSDQATFAFAGRFGLACRRAGLRPSTTTRPDSVSSTRWPRDGERLTAILANSNRITVRRPLGGRPSHHVPSVPSRKFVR